MDRQPSPDDRPDERGGYGASDDCDAPSRHATPDDSDVTDGPDTLDRRDTRVPDSKSEPVPGPESPAELADRARQYARSVPIDVDADRIEWEVSHRAKRRAGACLYRPVSELITIRLTWAAYEAFGWERFTGTIRHELIHALEFRERGESGHGPFFRRWADRLDAPRHCPRFSPPAYWIRCIRCGERSARYRRSRIVDEPERYRCGSCEGRLTVEQCDSDRVER